MKFAIDEFEKVGKIVKQSDVYTVIDVSKLEHLNVSLTILHPRKETGGHSHEGAEEVYNFAEGEGKMKLDDREFAVKRGDIVIIPDGMFHKVFNTGKTDLKFVCVFEKYGERK
ncbi:MAG: cupin domain-containing protein [Candidatus Aenigmatarchaeota archaeon]|nr:MAG: cupin domain-containing protein [Candidatus Aenigmarchaeota archaeon]